MIRNQQVNGSIPFIGSRFQGVAAKLLPLFLICLLQLTTSCGGGGYDPGPSAALVAEQTDYFDGVTYHRFYRYSGHRIGYATSADGIGFTPYASNPVLNGAYPVLVKDGDAVYLIVRDMATGRYNLYDVSVPTKPLFVRTVLEGDYCNMAVAVVDGVWHALIEGHDGDYFFIMYSVADPDGVFRSFLPVRGDAGNPTMSYMPERNAILAMYGADYKGTGVWRIRAAVMPLGGSWQDKGVVISKAGVHIADPDIGIGQDRQLIISVGYGQDRVSSYLLRGSRLDLYDAVMSGYVSLEDLGITMTEN